MAYREPCISVSVFEAKALLSRLLYNVAITWRRSICHAKCVGIHHPSTNIAISHVDARQLIRRASLCFILRSRTRKYKRVNRSKARQFNINLSRTIYLNSTLWWSKAPNKVLNWQTNETLLKYFFRALQQCSCWRCLGKTNSPWGEGLY